jgi:hypothetical protein
MKVQLVDQSPIRRIRSPYRAENAAVARVEPGRASMPAFQRHLLMHPQKVFSESFEGHDGVQTTVIEEKSVMANVQHGSFFQEGADDGRWADGCVLPPRSKANGQPEVANSICLGERRWH